MRLSLSRRAFAAACLCIFVSDALGYDMNRLEHRPAHKRQNYVQTCNYDEILGVFVSFTQYKAEYSTQCRSYLSIPPSTSTAGTADTPIV